METHKANEQQEEEKEDVGKGRKILYNRLRFGLCVMFIQLSPHFQLNEYPF